jgi:hypothetical protein
MERELASMWVLSFVVPPDHGTLPRCRLLAVLFCYSVNYGFKLVVSVCLLVVVAVFYPFV